MEGINPEVDTLLTQQGRGGLRPAPVSVVAQQQCCRAAGPQVCCHQLYDTQVVVNTISGPPLIISLREYQWWTTDGADDFLGVVQLVAADLSKGRQQQHLRCTSAGPGAGSQPPQLPGGLADTAATTA